MQSRPWKPDLASELLVRVGGDELVKRLAPLTEFEFKVANGVKVKRATTAPDLKIQYWAVIILAEIDPKSLTEEGKKAASKKLKCHWALENQPEMGASKPASGFGDWLVFLFGSHRRSLHRFSTESLTG